MTQSIDKQTKIAGKDYTLRFSWKAVAALGDLWGCETPDATLKRLGELQQMGSLDIKSAADLLWASLRSLHPEVSRDDVENLIDEHGMFRLPEIVSDLSDAIAGSQPPGDRELPFEDSPEELTLDDLLAEFCASGGSAAVFWDTTPRQTYAQMKGEATRRRRDTQQTIYLAWHVAAFERQKKLPALEPILRKLGLPMRPMSNSQLRAAVIGLAHAMNAKVIYRKSGEH